MPKVYIVIDQSHLENEDNKNILDIANSLYKLFLSSNLDKQMGENTIVYVNVSTGDVWVDDSKNT